MDRPARPEQVVDRAVDEPVLLDQRQAGELRRAHVSVEMIAAGEVLDAHLRPGDRAPDQLLDFGDIGHFEKISDRCDGPVREGRTRYPV